MNFGDLAKIKDAGAARDFAINWQNWQSTRSMSWGEMAKWQEGLTHLAQKFGLENEFAENGLIGDISEKAKGLFGKSRGSVSIEPLRNAVNAVKQGMMNQGARNALEVEEKAFSSGVPITKEDIQGIVNLSPRGSMRSFFEYPMAIPALGGALGTGALMAAGAGGMIGGAIDYATAEYLKTMQMQEQAKQAQNLAYALENDFRDKNGLPVKPQPGNISNQHALPYIRGL